jgi:hypothetical protein
MFPATKKSKEDAFFLYPDVCKTPAPPAPFIPVPYPLDAPPLGARKSSKTKLNRKGVAVMKKMARSSGDEAGTLGGALVGRLQTLGFSKGGAKLMVQGKPVVMGADVKLLHGFLSGSRTDNSSP